MSEKHTRANVSRESVLKAMAEFDRVGREAFLDKHGYGSSNRYKVSHEGREYDSKAILGVAFGYEYGVAPLNSSEFSGGAEHCGKLLKRLGFKVSKKSLGAKVASVARRAKKTVAEFAAAAKKLIVGLVSCSKSKLSEAAPARELYSPSYVFDRSARYVEEHCDEWWILSAKHGLVAPSAILEPYNETLSGAPKKVRDAWSAEVREALRQRYEGHEVKFILMAGSSYAGATEGLDAEVEEPMKGLGTGFRRQWLAART